MREDEVFVRAFCAVITGRVAKGTSPLDESPLDFLREEATDVATVAVEAWRNRPTKPGVRPVPKGLVEEDRYYALLKAVGAILDARKGPSESRDVYLEEAISRAEQIHRAELKRLREESE